MQSQLVAPQRLDYLDAVRALALLLGILFHASLAYLPMFIGWAVMDINTSNVAGVFALLSHAFRMELFFLLAGFFSAMTMKRRGLRSFIASRLIRLGVPFLLGWLILRPLLVSGWEMGAQAMRGDVDILAGLAQGFASMALLPENLLLGTHLWFLYYLMLISMFALAIRGVFAKLRFEYSHASHLLANLFKCLSSGKGRFWLLALLTAPVLWFMRSWGVDTPDKSLMPHVPVTLLYAGFFGFGWYLHTVPKAMDAFSKLSWSNGFLTLVCAIAMIGLSPYEMQAGHEYHSWFKGIFVFACSLFMWLMVALSIGLCRKLFSKISGSMRYVADASYWLYLVHLPFVVWLQVWVSEWPVPWFVKWFLVSLITLVIGLLSYHLMVRHSFVGRVLNGPRRSA
ncbi:acyltransferase family protein [Planctobacterium marinum]|uniref:Acyltransferase 3 domain-containing protein n=1 Tax=Planctobacterium marinum TaxID=1631968 RepID=A0AA48KNW7_9ALTE|nr:hypothetical protein MACH26_03240 [Planctobacterium marinum]